MTNGMHSILGGAGFDMSAGFGPALPAVAASSQQITNEQGTGAPVAHVSFGVAGLFLVALLGLVVLNRAGFRFSVTVG